MRAWVRACVGACISAWACACVCGVAHSLLLRGAAQGWGRGISGMAAPCSEVGERRVFSARLRVRVGLPLASVSGTSPPPTQPPHHPTPVPACRPLGRQAPRWCT